ncbi:MAG: cytochrome c [Vicinamibacteria bacterium]
MKRVLSVVGLVAGAASLVMATSGFGAPGQAQKVERGRYLVSTIGCGDCHTPKKMTSQGPVEDESRLLSGHPEGSRLPPPPAPGAGPWIATASWDLTAWSGPWGVSYTFNLTPDENTGIGSWSEETFRNALRTGRHMGVARPILPPMPWAFYRNLTDEDLSAVYAYLRSIPPVKNRVPEPVLAEATPAAASN